MDDEIVKDDGTEDGRSDVFDLSSDRGGQWRVDRSTKKDTKVDMSNMDRSRAVFLTYTK
ncbi:hypothetical protein DFA_05039 [Cavenderia fasciculata]|uniref:Uncharacterized protein n=1 Tax=Cavenderia fasciculata TaxID=261658 RepID=F4PN16_CACFS|nr:uncharacterized protein DFA_05039 [Cavenderia fasciculata]EGG22909.1 hypothetical protein DFA_05039 [Cavenderia fasciculata]|eukprot:XP_004360760.1 hypothetical protein DFA_05039 [Cavenderia fasciculata]